MATCHPGSSVDGFVTRCLKKIDEKYNLRILKLTE